MGWKSGIYEILRKCCCCCWNPFYETFSAQRGYCRINHSTDCPPEAYIYNYPKSQANTKAHKKMDAKLRNICECRSYDMDDQFCNRENIPIFVVCLQKTRPIEDLDGALEDFTDEELRRIFFIYIIPDDRYWLRKDDIPSSNRYSKYQNIVEINNYSENSRSQKTFSDKLRKDLSNFQQQQREQ